MRVSGRGGMGRRREGEAHTAGGAQDASVKAIKGVQGRRKGCRRSVLDPCLVHAAHQPGLKRHPTTPSLLMLFGQGDLSPWQ